MVNFVTGTEVFKIQKQPPKVFLKILPKFTGPKPTPESTPMSESVLIKLQAWGLHFYLKKRLRRKCFSVNLWNFQEQLFCKRLFLEIWKLMYVSVRPQLSDKNLFWKYLENTQSISASDGNFRQVTSSVKPKIGWIYLTIKIR